MMDFFDQKLTTAKKSIKNLLIDFSTWQTNLAEHKRTVREMDRRVEAMENVQEDVDLEHLEGKENFSVQDII